MKSLQVKLGISDRRYTEVFSQNLKEGDAVIVELANGEQPEQKQGMKFRMAP